MFFLVSSPSNEDHSEAVLEQGKAPSSAVTWPGETRRLAKGLRASVAHYGPATVLRASAALCVLVASSIRVSGPRLDRQLPRR